MTGCDTVSDMTRPAHAARDRRAAGARHRAARRPGTHPARPYRRADRARLRRQRRDHLRRRVLAGRPLRADPAAGAVQDGRRRGAVHRRQPHRAGQRPAGAGSVHPHRRIRHPAPLGRTHRHPDRLSGDLGQPLDEHRDGIRRGRTARGGRLGHHPVAGQSGDRDAGALQDPPRRGQPAAVHRGDRGLRHPARRDDGGAAAGDGAPDRPRDRLRRRRTRHRRPPAAAAARGAAGRQRHCARTDRARLSRQSRAAVQGTGGRHAGRTRRLCRTPSCSTSPRWPRSSAIRRPWRRRIRR